MKKRSFDVVNNCDMSSFEVLSLKTTVSDPGNSSCKFHCCVPIYSTHQTFYSDQAHMPDIHSDEHNICPEHISFWSKSPRSESPLSGSGTLNYVDSLTTSYNIQQQSYYQQLQITNSYKAGNNYMDSVISVPVDDINRTHCHNIGGGMVRGVKRRNTANKKERRRTQSINAAFQDLKKRIPNVAADTKLSKIKTLRLATSYISYLMGALEANEPAIGFRADLVANGLHSSRRSVVRKNKDNSSMDCTFLQDRGSPVESFDSANMEDESNSMSNSVRKTKARTGWPQHVWALELKQEQNL